MFGYYLELALRSLKRSPGLTLLMILALGFGVAASMTTWSVFRAVSGNPIPSKSSELFVPQIDMWGPGGRNPDFAGEPPNRLDYSNAIALMQAHRAKFQSAMYMISPSVVPTEPGTHPLNTTGYAVYNEFFPMLDIPFKYGGGWSAADDADRAAVVVINSGLNQKIFDGKDSIGKTLNIGGRYYRVAGVLDDWNPQPRFYDATNTGFSNNQVGVFMPFLTAISAGIPTTGNTNCSKEPTEPGFAGLQRSTCAWIPFMVQLDSRTAVQQYKDYLEGLSSQRYSWPPNVRLLDLMHWLAHVHVVPSDSKASLLVGLGLLIVSLINTAGLLLAKFMRRKVEIGVRRALGATRYEIYAQFLTEAAIVGVAGGVAGLLLTWLGVVGIRVALPSDIASLAHINFSLLVTTVGLAIVASVLAGLYPTWRAASIQPARAVKTS